MSACRSRRRLVSGDAEGTVCLWDANTHARLVTATLKGQSIRGVSFLRDGQAIAIGLEAGELQFLDRQLKLIRRWKTEDKGNYVCVLARGAIASRGEKLLQLWDLASSKLLAKVARKKSAHAKLSDEQGRCC